MQLVANLIFSKKRRHLKRYAAIGRILVRYGIEPLLSRAGLADLLRVRGNIHGALPGPVQVRQAVEEIGPTFIKLGQALSTRQDMVPAEYAAELAKLQDSAPAVPASDVRRIIEEELCGSPESVFAKFEMAPVAAASLGQAHFASLEDGTEVVVKVQRPGVREMIETDLEIISGIASFLEAHFEWATAYQLSNMAEEFTITLLWELDYTREGRKADLIRKNLSDISYVRVPETFWEYTTPKVLTEGRLDGVKITDMAGIAALGCDRSAVAKNLWRVYLTMIFQDGVFHGDAHPGNLLVMPGNTIGLLDHGSIGQLDRKLRREVGLLLLMYEQQNSDGFAEVLLDMDVSSHSIDRKPFVQEIDRLLRQYYGSSVGDMKLGELLVPALRISGKYGVHLPTSLMLVVRIILGVESITGELDPTYNLVSEVRPYAEQAILDEFSTERLRYDASENVLHWKRLVYELPRNASRVLASLSGSTLGMDFRHKGLDKPIREVTGAANRLTYSVIAASSMIAGSVAMLSHSGPSWMGYPLPSMIGFIVAILFIMGILVSVARSGK